MDGMISPPPWMEKTECGVCYLMYQKGTPEPLVLPCSHSFCRNCLTKIRNPEYIVCPICRKVHMGIGVTDLPINYAILKITAGLLTRPQIQKPPPKYKVFLNLKVGEQFLGHVHINVWDSLLRGQHFLSLCLDSIGATLVKTRFNRVENKNREREYIVCGESCASNIMKNVEWNSSLEWGKEYAKPANEGMLIGVRGGMFGICTRGQPGGVFQCPFGEVSSPEELEVVRRAALHEPVTNVFICNYGLVIEDEDEDKDDDKDKDNDKDLQ